MVNIIKQEIIIEESLKKRLKLICEFENVKPIFINDNLRKIYKIVNDTIRMYKKCNIKMQTFLSFNYSNDISTENLSNKLKLSKSQAFISRL